MLTAGAHIRGLAARSDGIVRIGGMIAVLILAACLALPASSDANKPTGALSQLPGPSNCVGEEGFALASGCGTQVPYGLNFAYEVQVSPDGRNAYSVAGGGDLIEYSRDPASGALAVIGCFSSQPSTEAPCAPKNVNLNVTAVDEPVALAISPDGADVYVVAQGGDANDLVTFSRDSGTGLLTKQGCIAHEAPGGECETRGAKGLNMPYGVAVSPDGKNVYVASYSEDAVSEFSRNTESGAVEQLPAPNNCISSDEASECGTTSAVGLERAIGIVVSPDGKDVYAAAGGESGEGAIVALERDPGTGALTQLPEEAGCISTSNEACAHGTAINGPEDLVVSPDGKNIYANSYDDGAVIELDRNPETGALTQLGCLANSLAGETGPCTQVKSIAGALGVAISPGGQNLYVSSNNEDAVAAFERNPETGALAQLAEPYGCVTSNGSGCAEGSTELTGLDGPRRLTVSPDGFNVYVAGQSAHTIVELARAQSTTVINYPNFSGATGLQLNGVASLTGSTLQLTPAEEFTSGTAFSRSEIQTTGSFETEFELKMHGSNTLESFGTYADGMAFVLQPDSAEQLGEVGGDLGYAGITPSAVVQFDIYQNSYDPPVPYISFMEDGNPEVHLAESGTLPFELYGETPVHAWISYDAGSHELSVYAAPSGANKPTEPLITYEVNLAELLGSNYTLAGFTAGTGSGDAVQEVLNWQLSSERSTNTVSRPSVTSVTPSEGPFGTGTPVTIKGTGFLPGATVEFGGASSGEVVVVSETEITTTTPPGLDVPAEVVVHDAGGTSTGGPEFTPTFATPTVKSITPNTGAAAGGTSVKIYGTGFYPGAEVTIGGSATEVEFVSETELTATTPPGEGAPEVVVTDKGGSSTMGPTYTYEAPPCTTKPAIEEQPKAQTVTEPAGASFKATASTPAHCAAPSVEWSEKAPGATSFTPILGAESDTYSIATTSTSESGAEFEATFKNAAAGETTTDAVKLTVNAAPCTTKPAIEEQPKAQTVTEPAGASFKATASTPAHCAAPSVEWSEKAPGATSFTPILGAESDTYSIATTSTSESGAEFEATFKNAAAGETTTDAVKLTVNAAPCTTKPAIEEQPKAQTVTEPAGASFKATASTPAHCAAPSVEWSEKAPGATSFTPILGAESDTYSIATTSTSESGAEFEATFKNAAAGETTTDAVKLTVNAAPCTTKPAIEEQPKAQTVTEPAGASFKATASTPAHCAAPSVEWSEKAPGATSFTPILGAESDTYSIATTSTSESGAEFEATFKNAAAGETTTDAVKLTVNAAPCTTKPAIEEQPKAQTVTEPAGASFKATASTPAHCAAPSVEWSEKAPGATSFTPILGAESDTYSIATTSTSESGAEFEATFKNAAAGETTTDAVKLTVNAAPCTTKPAIEEQPKAQTVTEPAGASFKATASTPAHCAAPSVEWSEKAPGATSFTPILGAESDTYSIATTSTSESGAEFEATFKNAAAGETTTDAVKLTVNAAPCTTKPAIEEQPKAQTVTEPAGASFKATASTPAHCAAPSVEWSEKAPGATSFTPILGAESDTYSIATTSTSESGAEFEATFKNAAAGETTTDAVKLTVNAAPCTTKPAIEEQPKAQTVTEPAGASFKATASTPAHCAAPSVEWSEKAPGATSFTPILGAESDTYSIATTSTSESGAEFEATFKNAAAGETTTDAVKLTVNAAPCTTKPAIEEQPKAQTVTEPAGASFKATASTPAHCAAPSVEWSEKAPGATSFTPILGAESDTYSIATTSTSESGAEFEATFKNAAAGETTTDAVKLTVNAAPCTTKPAIEEQPKAQTVTEPAGASFKATASTPAHCAAPSVEWSEKAPGATSFTPILGAESDTYSIATTSTSESGAEFEATFKNAAAGETTTDAVKLTVNAAPCTTKPAIEEQPKAQTVTEPAGASFKATASTPAHCAAPSVEWSEKAPGATSFTPILGAESDTYSIATTSTSESGAEFEATFKNAAAGETTTDAVKLTVNAALAKPEVSKQPSSATVTAPEGASFTAEAAGNPTPTVQWELSEKGGAFKEVPGATSDTYTILATSSAESGNRYEAVFTNTQGKATSDPATLTVEPALAKPEVSKQPSSATVTAPEGASFTAEAAGNPTPTVQWELSEKGGAFKEVPGATSDTYTILATSSAESGNRYEAVFTNTQGKATSDPATLTVNAALAKPEVSKQPSSATVTAPEGASFTAEAAGNPTPTVQWELSEKGGAFKEVPGATSDTYTILATSSAESGNRYEAVFTNTQGKATSDPATLTVNAALAKPEVSKQPSSATVTAPEGASFTAEAAGNPTPTVQWELSEKGGAFKEVPGATSDTYTILATSSAESGNRYEAVFTNTQGKATSDPATLTVNPPLCAADPAITEQPKDQVVTAPATASFKAAASTPVNCAAPTVQWSSEAPGAGSFTAISGATSPTYTTPATSTTQSGTKFEATFTNAFGKTTTEEVTLTVNPPLCAADPAITEQPKDQVVTAPATASFKAAASTPVNCAAPTVQWSSEAPGAGSFTAISGATSPTYTTPATSTTQSGTKFEATFTNAFGKTTTEEVTLTVNPPLCAADPAITEQPKDQVVTAPATASFKAAASTPVNCAAPTVQWSSEAPGAGSFTAISGATSPTYTTPATSTTQSGTKFEATFTNAFGKTTTEEVTLTVEPALAKPEVSKQPSSATVTAPEGASFTAEAAGNPTPTVQWELSEKGGAFKEVPGATSDTYTILATSSAESGNRYEAVFTNTQGKATSDPATLTVEPPLPVVEAITPGEGPLTGSTPVKITGKGFLKGAMVTIGLSASSVVVVSEEEITALTPAGSGTQEVVVSDKGGSSTLGPLFTYVTVAPTVEAKAASALTQTSATLNGAVNPEGAEVSACEVEYGANTAYGKTAPCTPSPGSGSAPIAVSAAITGLTANTTYHFRISATNPGGTSKGSDETFKTLPNPPTVQAKPASLLTQTSATLNGAVNPEGAEVSKCEVEYGTGTAYGKTAPCSTPPGSGTSPVAVSAAITGLTANTTYHFRISATNAGGTSKGLDETFKTLPTAPAVVTKAASSVAQTAATLSATVNPNGGEVTTCNFEYGTGTAYGKTAPCSTLPGSGTSAVAVSVALTGLTANTTYHFRISATNAGDTSTGSDETFKTLPNPPTVEAKPASLLTQTSATLNGAVNPEGAEVSKCEVEYGTDTAYGKTAPCSTSPGSGTSPVAVSAALTGLTADTNYHFRISATNAGGTSKGSDETFKTQTNAPAVEAKQALSLTQTSAVLNGTVNPEGGEISSCDVEYGTSTTYGSSVPCTILPGSGSGPVAVSASLTGLTADTIYHFRISASNASGTSRGPDETFKTLATTTTTTTTSGTTAGGGATAKSGVLGSVAAAPPPPKFAVSGNVAPVTGSVLVKLPGSSIFVALTGIRQIPFGTVIDATNGSVTVKTVGPNGVIQTIVYSQGEFKLTQGSNGLVVATLVGGNFAVCPTARERGHLARTSSKHASSKHVVRKLWSEGHGKYSTKGNYAAGAVLGTRWLTEDLCDGTFIHVVTDRVAVTNFVNHRHLTVKAGHSYLAKAP